jgi:DNA-binding NarL/FixJ family response regulator
MNTRLRIVLADDHVLVRAGVRSLLERLPEVEVAAEVNSGDECVEAVSRLRPDLVVMDIAMAGSSGLTAAARLHREFPDVRVLMLSMHANRAYVEEALDAGVGGYLLKDAAAVELDLAIRAVMRGELYLSPAVSTLLAARPHEAGEPVLSPRQRDVLKLLAEGQSTKEIAFALGISTKTVETHRALLMKKLAIHDVAGLVKYAIRAGLTKS